MEGKFTAPINVSNCTQESKANFVECTLPTVFFYQTVFTVLFLYFKSKYIHSVPRIVALITVLANTGAHAYVGFYAAQAVF